MLLKTALKFLENNFLSKVLILLSLLDKNTTFRGINDTLDFVLTSFPNITPTNESLSLDQLDEMERFYFFPMQSSYSGTYKTHV